MKKRAFLKLTLTGMALGCSGLLADDYTWQADPLNNIWSTTDQNWNADDGWPVSVGHTAIFGTSTKQSVNVGEPLGVGAIRFLADGYRIGGATITFSGETPYIAVESASVTSLVESAIYNDSTLSKSGPGVLSLGAAAYNGETNVRDVVVAEGMLQVEDGRTLCSTGRLSVAAGAAYVQSGGTNLMLSGGDVLVLGDGAAQQPAWFEVTGGVWHAKATAAAAGGNSRVVLGRDSDAWFRIAGDADLWAVVFEMTELAAGRSATLQLDGGRLTVARMTGSGGVNNTQSRILLNGGELYAERGNSSFLSAMTEALVQGGGMAVNVPASFFKTAQLLEHDPALGATLDGGLTKRGAGALHLQRSNTYNGTNRIEQGTVVAEADHALGYGPIEVGIAGSTAAIAATGGHHTLTNRVIFGLNGSACAGVNASLTLKEIGFVQDQEQIKVGGAVADGTVHLTLDPASTTLVYNVFVYDSNTLILDGGTTIRRIDPVPGGISARVDVRVGSVMAVRDADIQMPDIAYLLLGGGEYRQEGGRTVFPHVWASTNWPSSSQRGVPARVTVEDGELTFASGRMYSPSSRRGTETIINGGLLKTSQLNISKNTGANATLSHLVELNGGTLEVAEILYDGGADAVEPAVIRFNGGTLKVAATSTSTSDFISINNGLNLLSLNIGEGGFVCDTAGKDILINQPFQPDLDLNPEASDGGIRKIGAGSLTLTKTLEMAGPVVVDEGELKIFDLRLANTNLTVAAGGKLTICGGSFSNALFDVAAGGTLTFSFGNAEERVINGSFENNTWGATLEYKYLDAGSSDVPGWTFLPVVLNRVGIQKNGCPFTKTTPWTTNGTTTIMLKEGTVKTTVVIPQDGLYCLNFEHATRYGYNTAPKVDVMVDGLIVHSIVYPGFDHPYQQVTLQVALTQGEHEIAFKGNASGNPSVFVDAVSLTGVADIFAAGEDSELRLSTGSTLVLDNAETMYIERVYVDGRRVYTMNMLQGNGITVEGEGRLRTAAGGTVLQLR